MMRGWVVWSWQAKIWRNVSPRRSLPEKLVSVLMPDWVLDMKHQRLVHCFRKGCILLLTLCWTCRYSNVAYHRTVLLLHDTKLYKDRIWCLWALTSSAAACCPAFASGSLKPCGVLADQRVHSVKAIQDFIVLGFYWQDIYRTCNLCNTWTADRVWRA